MLRCVGETVDSKDAVVKIKDASFPTPFVSALEYNSPVMATGILCIRECRFRNLSRSMSVRITVCVELY